MTGGVHFDLVKRVLRDIKRSGQAPEEIIQQVGSLHPNHCNSLHLLTDMACRVICTRRRAGGTSAMLCHNEVGAQDYH